MRRTVLVFAAAALALAACGDQGEVVGRTAPTEVASPSPAELTPSPTPTLASPTATPSPEPPSTFLNLRVRHATIGNFVIDLYQGVFGDDPTPKELQDWTDYIIRTGNHLQRDSGLLPDDALEEALARGLNKFLNDPYVRWLMENQQENEALNEAMETAIEAIEGLSP